MTLHRKDHAVTMEVAVARIVHGHRAVVGKGLQRLTSCDGRTVERGIARHLASVRVGHRLGQGVLVLQQLCLRNGVHVVGPGDHVHAVIAEVSNLRNDAVGKLVLDVQVPLMRGGRRGLGHGVVDGLAKEEVRSASSAYRLQDGGRKTTVELEGLDDTRVRTGKRRGGAAKALSGGLKELIAVVDVVNAETCTDRDLGIAQQVPCKANARAKGSIAVWNKAAAHAACVRILRDAPQAGDGTDELRVEVAEAIVVLVALLLKVIAKTHVKGQPWGDLPVVLQEAAGGVTPIAVAAVDDLRGALHYAQQEAGIRTAGAGGSARQVGECRRERKVARWRSLLRIVGARDAQVDPGAEGVLAPHHRQRVREHGIRGVALARRCPFTAGKPVPVKVGTRYPAH